MSRAVRRVVTGHDAFGRAVVVSDGATPGTFSPRKGFQFSELWSTSAMPVPIDNGVDPALGPLILPPPANGSVFRIVDHPPRAQDDTLEDARALFTALGSPNSVTGSDELGHSTMHRTETVDYGIVLEGKIWLILDNSEVELEAGDVVVQRGTSHAWFNRSDAPCRMAFIMLDGKYAGE